MTLQETSSRKGLRHPGRLVSDKFQRPAAQTNDRVINSAPFRFNQSLLKGIGWRH